MFHCASMSKLSGIEQSVCTLFGQFGTSLWLLASLYFCWLMWLLILVMLTQTDARLSYPIFCTTNKPTNDSSSFSHCYIYLLRWCYFLVAGAEVAVLCITKSGEVLNYQAFTDSMGIYRVAETMPEIDRWDACLARPISSFHEHCTRQGEGNSGLKFRYNHPSGYSHAVRPFVYRPTNVPTYCI